ncbi:MAG: AI-2E family transporter [Gammaproteobacteria bacterium]|nr:AI-2E family transporter [Pseudomonadales bacterium]MCP5345988.1 AI-2E family transporter [Pseudomonadales bacterium]
MRRLLHDFYQRYFHDDESLILLILLALALLFLYLFGNSLAPLFASIIIAYLMQGPVIRLRALGVPRLVSFGVIYTLFIAAFLGLLLVVLPAVWNQLSRLLNELPRLISQWQDSLMLLPEQYPSLFTEQQVDELVRSARGELTVLGQTMVTYSIASIPRVISLVIFMVLVPILVFFLLKDRDPLVRWVTNFLPRNRPLMIKIWQEMDLQLSNYIRGKVLEIFLVGAATYLVFIFIGIDYALLLSVLVGLSVVVPYIGATVVTVPVLAVAYVQWGVGSEFYTITIAYIVIQIVDGNVLAPIIFSETNNLHPIAVIAAVLVFGGIWGLAGVFFAIPLATFVKAIINAWPSRVQSRVSEAPVRNPAASDASPAPSRPR